MRNLPFGLLIGSLPLLAGCGEAPAQPRARPMPGIDAAAPAKTETATFALG